MVYYINEQVAVKVLNTANKILAQILYKRLSTILEPQLRENQVDSRTDKTYVDNINTLRFMIEQSAKWSSPLCMMFIDFRCAFDSIKYASTWHSNR